MASLTQLSSHLAGENIVTTGLLVIAENYATGGLSITPTILAQLPNIQGKILGVQLAASGTTVVGSAWDATNQKLILYNLNAGAVREIPNATALSLSLPIIITTR